MTDRRMPNSASMFGQRRHRAPKSPAKNKRRGSKIRPQPDSKVGHTGPSHGNGAARPNTTSSGCRSWKTGTKSELRKIATYPAHEGAPPLFFKLVDPDREEGASPQVFKFVDPDREEGTFARASIFNTVDECSSDSEVESINEEDYAHRLDILRADSDGSEGFSPRIPSPPRWAPVGRRFELPPPYYLGPNAIL